MARIFYSMAGEGRGHAARVRALTEHLRRRHEVHLFAPGDAHTFLAPLYASTGIANGVGVRVHEIPGLGFRYDAARRMDPWRTGAAAVSYVAGLPRLVRELRRRIEDEAPDLVLTDFEPALPRAARAAGVPFVSLSHQHFLVVSDLRGLPARLRMHAAAMGALVRLWHQGQAETIVSSFYSPPLAAAHLDALQIGVLIRPELAALQATHGEHLLAYFRREAPPGALEALASCGREVRAYVPRAALPERDFGASLKVAATGSETFLTDLASCAGVVTTAGNQLVGEALHFAKPVLAMPEDGNAEQEINAHFLARTGAGRACAPGRLTAADLARFLAELERLRAVAVSLEDVDGTQRALARVERHLDFRRERAMVRALGWST